MAHAETHTQPAADHCSHAARVASGALDLSIDWDTRSYQIAQRLQARNAWAAYLTPAELPWLAKALESPENWSKFISPRTEQWRASAPPPPIFDISVTKTPQETGSGSPMPTASRRPSEMAGSKRNAPPDGMVRDGDDVRIGKRPRTSTLNSLELDDEMMSVLSESDIDIAVWTNDASVASNGMSPVSTDENNTRRASPGATVQIKDCVAAENSLVCAMAAFHTRAAIYEQYVDALCNDECGMCKGAVEARRDIEEVEEALAPKAEPQKDDPEPSARVPSLMELNAPAKLVSRSLDEDEDYDDDDGEADEADEADKAMANKDEGKEDGEAKPVKVKTEEPERPPANPPASTDQQPAPADTDTPVGPVQISTRAVIRTLDEQDEAVAEQSRLESNRRAVREVQEQRAAEPKDMLVNQIGSLYHMKNLAQFIDNHRDSVSMSTRELTHLLSEVRPKRSKWASDRRVGQEQLYNALEQALTELKTMGAASAPFLTQVKRRDAPDYYDVIINPMDLGTMTKKLRAQHYNSKDEFWNDVQLIRDNCYMYNTEPGNVYRRNAETMLKKARHLMESVPNIVVRERDGSAAAAVADDFATEFGDESGDESQGARTIYGQREGSILADEGTPAPGSSGDPVNASMASVNEEFVAAVPPAAVQQPAQSALAQSLMRATANGTLARDPVSGLTEGIDLPLGEKVWRARARKLLLDHARQTDADRSVALSERRAPARSAKKMAAFDQNAHETFEFLSKEDLELIEQPGDISELLTVIPHASGGTGAAVARKRNEALDEKRMEWQKRADELDMHAYSFVCESETAAGLPQSESLVDQVQKDGVVKWLDEDCELTVAERFADLPSESAVLAAATAERPSLEAYAAGRMPNNRMWRGMADNIDQLRRIREINNKIWAAKLNLPVNFLAPQGRASGTRASMANGSEDAASFQTRDLYSDLATQPDPPGAFRLDASGSRKMLERVIALVLAHTGFEAISADAMSCLSEFIMDYMRNLGRTLRTYSDKYSRTMSGEAILAHTLYENGAEDLVELEYFVRADAERNGLKLADIYKNISKSYRDVVSDSRPDSVIDDSTLNGAYLTGDVGGLGEMGDDFFGFKALGLDKELGIENLAIPQRLWHGRAKTTGSEEAQPNPDDALPFPPPAPWTPVTTPAGQIGLVQSFLCEKLKAKNGVCPPGFEHLDAKPDSASKDAAASKDESKAPETWEAIPEDDDLPPKSRFGATRPKVPAPNYLTHPRTHMHVGSGKPVAPSNRSAKKKPAKTTAASKTAASKSSTAGKTTASKTTTASKSLKSTEPKKKK
ncbi:Transcriptional activator spt7 [Linderina macrospora]|uniref:Transcriptional activator spt7 n=1 Tax=Linderina macrospora TaxID=4868 RepID=A0ACC1JG66_9FUNG|nr:Transcriptional activator spt7 [Linderina macrospora]